MSKTKSISDMILELQKENDSLKILSKLFNQACLKIFGYDCKTVDLMLKKQAAYDKRKVAKQGSQAQDEQSES